MSAAGRGTLGPDLVASGETDTAGRPHPDVAWAPNRNQMDPTEYVEARWSALVRAAVLLGASDAEAPAIVRSVLEANTRRIRRSDDPDDLVHRALAAAVPGAEATTFGAEPDLEARREMLVEADDVVTPPEAAPLLTRPHRRRWPIAAGLLALVLVAAVTVVVSRDDGQEPPAPDVLRDDQVPSLF